ncbi:MAG TPA: efflux RND transporter permease subunit [Candidatus Coprenecus avistercoris]|uniref:Efflux RND transporter permease subunit n=1 Tax=Candidatus Coprenecus avistercoris TaxID=2840730 RepID=A0A9D1J708_9BACT|nr:efflux RND transporter permease subunit [Candidatus Coprenecus avistercoris]
MIRKLIKRPVAVSMVLFAVAVLGAVSIKLIPVSLMPDVDIPQITVQVKVEGSSAREMDEYLQPLRRQLMQIPSLTDIRSQSESGVGIIRLSFDYGADIDFIFVEVNERIDRAMSSLPEGAERPKALKSSATDIPAFFVNMTVRDTSRTMELSRLASSVISKRIEQIPEVAMVDLSGLVFPEILIIPDIDRLTAIGVTPERLSEAIEANNIRLGNLSIRDGQYHWNIRFNSEINSKDDIENIRLNIGGRVYRFSELAEVIEQPASEDCLIRSDGSRAVSMAIIKQSDARMNTLQDELNDRIEEFRDDYPGVEFTVTRDQTELLRYTIENLEQNLYAGIILASIVILLFMRNFRFSLLIIPTIIVSLLTSMLALFLMGISINIISLAGLILSVGMMVDNSIIVIDNITQRWERGDNLEDAVAIGSGEVFAPMLSSILTNCAVFVPLVFLSGIAGEIFFDQAVAITVGLFSSLLFAVLVVPVYYYAMYRRRGRKVDNKYLARIDRFLELGPSYEKALKWTFRHQGTVLTLMAVSIPLSVLLFMELDKSTFPPVTKSDIILNVDWNRPVTIAENDRRSTALVESVQPHTAQVTQMCGTQQFLMPHTRDMSQSEAQIYFKARTAEGLDSLMNGAAAFLREHYPDASFNFTDAGNLFTLMFSSDGSKLTVQISGRDGRTPEPDRLNSILADIGEAAPDVYISPISWQEQIMLVLDIEKMSLYGISYSDVLSTLRKRTREDNIFSITTGDYSIPVVVGDRDRSPDLLNGSVRNRDGADIPLSSFITEGRSRDLKTIVSGMSGNFYPLELDIPDSEVPGVMATARELSVEDGTWDVAFSGSYFSSRETIRELMMIAVVAILLLYLILAAQFESIIQPLIILSEIVVDIFGALLLLWICGGGINAMSMIGIVVMSGIVINDSILKVDTINRLRKENGYGLLRAIMTGGSRRLNPILMTTLTTVLAMVPFLTRGDMGSDLQYPMSIVMIGGMIVGLIVSIFGIPLIYYRIYRKKSR